MKFGYARVSTGDQNLSAQRDALKACDRIYEEKASGGRWDRPELHKMLEFMRAGDVLVVWKLDRLSRSLRDLLVLMERLKEMGVGFVSLTESIDTTTPGGRVMLSLVGAIAEFEREMVRERTKVALEQSKKRGKRLGRPPKLTDEQREEIRGLLLEGLLSKAEIARRYGVSASLISKLSPLRHCSQL